MLPAKIVLRGSQARNKLIDGANFLADCVKQTLGPFGQNFCLEKGNRITNDGVSIAKEIQHKDEAMDRGIIVLREAATKTNDEVGDGTTTAIVLAQAILQEASKYLDDDERGIAGKRTPAEIKKQIETEKVEILEKLEAMAEPIKNKEDLIASAKVAVENDELAKLIGETQWELGPNGWITAEETAQNRSSIERVPGIRIDNGFGTAMLINNQEKQTLEVEYTMVIMTTHTLHDDLKPLQKVIDRLVQSGVKIITIVARAFGEQAIKVCLENVNRGAVKIYPISAPYVDQAEIMLDLQAILGGTYYHWEGSRLEDMQVSDVGFAEKVIGRRYDAIFTGKKDDQSQERVNKRIAELEEKLKGEPSDFMQANLKQRIAQLKNGFALLKVGAETQQERKYLKDKAEDAVNAVRVALQEGTVAGGGLAFKEIADELPDTYLLKRPLLSIHEQICYLAPKDFIIPEWVKDPIKVLRVALQNACSVAGTLATAAGVVTTENPKPRLVEEVKTKENNEE